MHVPGDRDGGVPERVQADPVSAAHLHAATTLAPRAVRPPARSAADERTFRDAGAAGPVGDTLDVVDAVTAYAASGASSTRSYCYRASNGQLASEEPDRKAFCGRFLLWQIVV